MSEELGTVLDAPEVTDEVVEQVAPEGAEAPVEGVEPVTPEVEVKGDERTMPQWIRNLKATDPIAFKAAKADFFGKRSLDEKLKDFDLDGTKGWLEENGGREAIVASLSELQGKAAEFDGIMQKVENGELPDLSPEAITKLGPVMAQQWAQHDHEGWSAAMSGVFAQTIADNGVPMFLEKMGMLLEFGKVEDVAKMVQDLKGWANGFAQKANAPRAPRTQQEPDKFAAREQELNQREQQAFNGEMQRSVESFRAPLISKELESFAKRRPNDTEAKELAVSTVASQVVQRLKADQKYQDSLNALWARKDKAGALKLIQSRETAAITEIAPKVGRMIFGNPGPAAVAKTAAQTAAAPQSGFALVDKPPAPDKIDRFRTTDAMIMRGQFILKDGRKLSLEG